MQDANYRSGDDVVLEFVDHRYAFGADDFRERVAAAAVRLELVGAGDVDDDVAGDLADVAIHGALASPRSALGHYLVERWEVVGGHGGHSLAYWLRKLVFRGAWLDHRVKAGALDIVFDQSAGDFRYHLPSSERPLVDAAPCPSWRAVRFPG